MFYYIRHVATQGGGNNTSALYSDSSRTAYEDPKRAPSRPKRTPRPPKRLPRGTRNGPKALQEGTAQRGPQDGLRRRQTDQEPPYNGLRGLERPPRDPRRPPRGPEEATQNIELPETAARGAPRVPKRSLRAQHTHFPHIPSGILAVPKNHLLLPSSCMRFQFHQSQVRQCLLTLQGSPARQRHALPNRIISQISCPSRSTSPASAV